jgi:hypothetical protein
MADKKVTDLTSKTSIAADDLLHLVDMSASPVNKKVVISNVVDNFKTTAQETANSVTPTNFHYPFGDVRRYGAVGDGSTDDTTAIQNAIDAVGDDGEVMFPDTGSGAYVFTTVTVDRERVRLTGNGQLNGSIKLRHYNYDTTNSLNQFVIIDGLRFKSSGQTKDAIVLNSTRRNLITNCYFEGFNRCIYIPANTDNTYGQHVNRCRITTNTYADVNHFILEELTAGITFSFADSIITGNEGTADVTHIELDTVDGVTIADNVFFFSGYTEQSAVKEQNIIITTGTWLHIHDNKLFEAGLEGIKLDKCARFSLHDNLYGYPGQRLESAALTITGVPLTGNYFTQSEVHSEIMIDPSGVGIDIGAKAGRLKAHSCLIQTPNGTASEITRYYGAPALSGSREAISINADTVDITTMNNSVRWGSWTANVGSNQSNTHLNNVVDSAGDGSSTRYETQVKVQTITSTATDIDVTRWDVVNLNQSGATNIADITNDSGQNKYVMFVAFNGNSTFVHDGVDIFLAGGANATLGTGDTITFYVATDSTAKEVSRAI